MIAGSSMGGLISLYAIAERPDVFGAAAAISTHWPLANPDTAPVPTVLGAIQDYLANARLDPETQRIWFDHGTEQLDSNYGAYQRVLDLWFAQYGFVPGQSVVTTVYEGTGHNEKAWATRLDDVFTFLIGIDTEPQPEPAPKVR